MIFHQNGDNVVCQINYERPNRYQHDGCLVTCVYVYDRVDGLDRITAVAMTTDGVKNKLKNKKKKSYTTDPKRRHGTDEF